MKIIEIGYKKVFNLGSYENEQIEVKAQIETKENGTEQIRILKDRVLKVQQLLRRLEKKSHEKFIVSIRTRQELDNYQMNCDQYGIPCDSIFYSKEKMEECKSRIEKEQSRQKEQLAITEESRKEILFCQDRMREITKEITEKENRILVLESEIDNIRKEIKELR